MAHTSILATPNAYLGNIVLGLTQEDETTPLSTQIATIIQLPISSTGTVLNKRTATIGQMMTATTQNRIKQSSNPNTDNNPTIEDYIILEAQSGRKVIHIDQTKIITASP